MDRHERHAVAGLIFRHVHIGQQRDILQIIPQAHPGQFGGRHFRGVRHHTVFDKGIHVVPLHLLLERLHAVQQLRHIGKARLSFHGRIGLIEKVEAAFRSQRHGGVIGISALRFRTRLFHHGTEGPYLGDGCAAEAVLLEGRQGSRPEK